MGRSAVRVVVRLRPTDKYSERVSAQDDGKTIVISMPRHVTSTAAGGAPSSSGASSATTLTDSHAYRTDLVLKDASQETVYETCASDVVKSAISGYTSCVFAYGMTGAGKTYTMVGGNDFRQRGIIPRSLKTVFEDVLSHADRQFTVQVSYIEIYNDKITDLLDPSSKEEFAVLEDSRGAITVRGATMRTCSQEQEALSCLFLGNQNRTSQQHAMNNNSSRSHAIFTIHISSRSRVESDSATLLGKVYLVDLAGSERLHVYDGTINPKSLKEAQHINKSLTFLEQVVMALGSTNRSHVPFRQSKLTNILKDALGGNSRTAMIANIWPEERNLEDTISTLKFATRMLRVQNDASVNIMVDPQTQVKQLQRQLGELKAELHMHNQLMGRGQIQYEGDISEDERFEMERITRNYLASKIGEIPIKSLREVKEYFRVFKAFADQRDAEMKALQAQVAQLQQQVDEGGSGTGGTSAKGAGSLKNAAAADKAAARNSGAALGGGGGSGTKAQQQQAAADAQAAAQQQQQQQPVAVGTLDPTAGQGLGVAAPSKNLREMAAGHRAQQQHLQQQQQYSPTGGIRERTPPASAGGMGGGDFDSSPQMMHYNNKGPNRGAGLSSLDVLGNNSGNVVPLPPVTPPNRNEAFVTFKSDGFGAALCDQIQQHVVSLKRITEELHQHGELVNTTKRMIDDATARLNRKQAARKPRAPTSSNQQQNQGQQQQQQDVIDDEEFDIVQEVKRHQKVYREAYEKHADARRARDNETRVMDRIKKQLLEGFEKWYTNTFRVGISAGSLQYNTMTSASVAPPSASQPRGGMSKAVNATNNNNNLSQNRYQRSSSMEVGVSGGAFGGYGTVSGGIGGDELDEGEKFDQLELQRVMGEDPESVAYFQAKKLASTTSKRTAAQRKK